MPSIPSDVEDVDHLPEKTATRKRERQPAPRSPKDRPDLFDSADYSGFSCAAAHAAFAATNQRRKSATNANFDVVAPLKTSTPLDATADSGPDSEPEAFQEGAVEVQAGSILGELPVQDPATQVLDYLAAVAATQQPLPVERK